MTVLILYEWYIPKLDNQLWPQWENNNLLFVKFYLHFSLCKLSNIDFHTALVVLCSLDRLSIKQRKSLDSDGMKPWGFINPFNRLVFVYKQMMGKADKLQRKMKWLYMDQTWCSNCLRAAVLSSLLNFQMNMCTVKKLQSTASQIFPCWKWSKEVYEWK